MTMDFVNVHVGETEAERKLGQAWNAYVFARAGLAPGAGMAVTPEPEAWERLSEAMRAWNDEVIDR